MAIEFEGPARAWQQAWTATAEGMVAEHPTALTYLACNQGFVFTHRQARGAGCSEAELRRNVYNDRWSVPRRGVPCLLPPGDGATPDGSRIEIRAAAAALVRPGAAISHDSAAAASGLPLVAHAAAPS